MHDAPMCDVVQGTGKRAYGNGSEEKCLSREKGNGERRKKSAFVNKAAFRLPMRCAKIYRLQPVALTAIHKKFAGQIINYSLLGALQNSVPVQLGYRSCRDVL